MAITKSGEGYLDIEKMANPQSNHDPEKADNQIYGTFPPSTNSATTKSESDSLVTQKQNQGYGLTGRIWLSLAAAAVIVVTMGMWAFVLVTVLL